MDPNLDGIGCVIIGAIIAGLYVLFIGEKHDDDD